jgi:hypothetical protein
MGFAPQHPHICPKIPATLNEAKISTSLGVARERLMSLWAMKKGEPLPFLD